MTVDVEDWFQTHNLEPGVDRDDWESYDSRVVDNTERLLELFDEYDVRATFFVLGWVAERHPDLVVEIERCGHEVGSHGYGHELLYDLDRTAVVEDLRRTHELLTELVDSPVRGYRAPSFSITDVAIDVLDELDYDYDSSLFDVPLHDRYGSLQRETETDEAVSPLRGTDLVEASLPTYSVFGSHLPWAGGGWFRFIPYCVYRRGIERILDRRPFVFYIHPWEIDPNQPRLTDGIPTTNRVRHYRNLDRTEERLGNLLDRFEWRALGDAVDTPDE
jgi:polysaccharide deacetylase family protein (PEP-CTERM system associated)